MASTKSNQRIKTVKNAFKLEKKKKMEQYRFYQKENEKKITSCDILF